jgi:hypothetical protein
MDFLAQAFELDTTTDAVTELIFIEDWSLESVGGGSIINTL